MYSDDLTRQLIGIAKNYPSITKIVLYGSRARGDNDPISDYDVCVYCTSDEDFMNYCSDIEDIDTHYTIDVVRHETLTNELLKEEILKDGVVLMSLKESKRDRFAMAVARLEEVLEQCSHTGLAREIIRDSIIKRFEFTLELAWKYLRFLLIDEGCLKQDVSSPKRTIQVAYANALITDGTVWIEMIGYRNTLVHTYDETAAIKLEKAIGETFISAFKELLAKV